METEAEPLAPPGEQPERELPRAALAYKWFQDRMPTSRRGRIILTVLVGAFVLVPSIALLILPFYIDLSDDRFATLGYTGVFVANLASTATVFIPVPGLTATGQTLINEQGSILNPFFVGLAGGLGMALGEVTAYAAGAVGSEVAREGNLEAPRIIRPIVTRLITWVDWLMDRYAFVTLLALSAIPNPAFEFAGITAGAVGMNFWRFMVAVTTGKVMRGMLLAYLGNKGIEILWFT